MIADVVMAVPEGGPTDNSAIWTPTLAQRGLYEVYAKWSASDNRPAAAQYFVLHVGGETEILVNQKLNGGQWNLLGTFDLEPGQAHVVLTDQAVGGGYVIADAIRFVEIAAPPPPPPNPLAHGLYFIDSDHLGTPRLVTDAANNVVWRDLPTTEPFGNSAPEENPSGAGSFVMPLAFPGQYRDNETALNYNYFRDYSPLGGRYAQSDPIGLAGGINTYAYVEGNPLSYTDPTGEFIFVPMLWGAGAGAVTDIALKLALNGGRLECIKWGQVGVSAGLGAVGGGVGGYLAKLRQVRQAYQNGLAAAREAELTAEQAWATRRALGQGLKQDTPAGARHWIYGRNARQYGDELGPPWNPQKMSDVTKTLTDTNPWLDGLLRLPSRGLPTAGGAVGGAAAAAAGDCTCQ